MSRYFAASGTAGLARNFVSGNRREPRPPPSTNVTTLPVQVPLRTSFLGEGVSIDSCRKHNGPGTDRQVRHRFSFQINGAGSPAESPIIAEKPSEPEAAGT